MENAFTSFLLGLTCTLVLFILCYVVVVGIKYIYLSLGNFYKKPTPKNVNAVHKPNQKRQQPKKSNAPIRSIEIDPEQIDKIYVKKSY